MITGTKVSVLASDIENAPLWEKTGEESVCRVCPTAKAINRTLGINNAEVGYSQFSIGQKDHRLPEHATRQIWAYQCGEMKPFDFIIGEEIKPWKYSDEIKNNLD